MATHTLTVELSDQEIAVLRDISSQDQISPNDALRKIILQAGYLRQETAEGNQLFIGKVTDDKMIKGDSIVGLNLK
ncbi:MAG: hypothetical protein ACKOX2_00635 [Microcystaceae cyanobacterium]|nr:hypothetical protein [Merismopediaceae bacterium]